MFNQLRLVIALLTFLICLVGFDLQASDCPGYQPPNTATSIAGYKYCKYYSQECAADGMGGCDLMYPGYSGLGYNSALNVCTQNGYNINGPTMVSILTCPSGYILGGSTCTLSVPSLVQCVSCGTNGTRYDDSLKSCVYDGPTTCPGLGSLHHPVTGACFDAPICAAPQFLSEDYTTCLNPDCGSSQTYNSNLRRCVNNVPTCPSGSHLVGDVEGVFAPHCEENPVCEMHTQYSCIGSVCGCRAPQDCGPGRHWAEVNGIYGCFSDTLAPDNIIHPAPNTPPDTTVKAPISGNLPGGGLPTPDGLPGPGSPSAPSCTPQNPNYKCRVYSEGEYCGCENPGGNNDNPITQPKPVCNDGNCLCRPGNGASSSGGVVCPPSGICPTGYYSTVTGGCSLNKDDSADCPPYQHYEYASSSCKPDNKSPTGPGGEGVKPSDINTVAITDRLDAANNKLDAANSKLGDINNKLGTLTDSNSPGLNDPQGDSLGGVITDFINQTVPSLAVSSDSCNPVIPIDIDTSYLTIHSNINLLLSDSVLSVARSILIVLMYVAYFKIMVT